MSSFAKAAAKFVYDPSLEIQKYRLQCGRIYEIMEKFGQMGKYWVDVAYGVWSAAAFLGICVLKLWRAALPDCGCVLIVDAYSFVPPPAADIPPFSSSWNENRALLELFKIVKIR